ncbi:NAD synthetase [Pseudomonas sp. MWU13-2100]|uniref:NAD synthetase n=1 Tax=Pseudomonas sp. MWU13-2100 TaxID=2935075 RepID=UPI00200EC809|nr:NAD synthetase [Pseudomonas sp. MWU13-2100]
MISDFLKSGVPNAHRNARQRVEGKVDLPRLFRAIDGDPAIAGAGVVYIESDFTVVTLREFRAICSVVPKKIVLREAPKHMAPLEFVRELETQPRESRLMAEAVGMGLACSGAAFSVLAVILGTALIPFTVGAGSVIAFAGGIAVRAAYAQCFIGTARTFLEVAAPEVNDYFDREIWYQAMTTTLDAISLLGVGVSGYTTWKVINTAKSSTGKSLRDVLKGLTRQERATLNREILKLQHPALTTKILKLKQASGELTKRLTPAQINQFTFYHVMDSLSAAASSMGSAQSGNIKTIAVSLYEVLDQ